MVTMRPSARQVPCLNIACFSDDRPVISRIFSNSFSSPGDYPSIFKLIASMISRDSGNLSSSALEKISSPLTKTSKLCSLPALSLTSMSNSAFISSANLAAVDLYAQEVQCRISTLTPPASDRSSSSSTANRTQLHARSRMRNNDMIFIPEVSMISPIASSVSDSF